MIKIFKSLLEHSFLCNLKPVRRFIGGCWELWWVDSPVCAEVWHRTICCPEGRPNHLCHGRVIKREIYIKECK